MTSSVLRALRAIYRTQLADADPTVAAIAAEQLERLRLGAAQARAGAHEVEIDDQPRDWAHVLAELVADAGNAVPSAPSHPFKTGHQPHHDSNSRTCLSVNPRRGLWFCASCGRGGTAVTWVRDLHHLTVVAAIAWLRGNYGAPHGAA